MLTFILHVNKVQLRLFSLYNDLKEDERTNDVITAEPNPR